MTGNCPAVLNFNQFICNSPIIVWDYIMGGVSGGGGGRSAPGKSFGEWDDVIGGGREWVFQPARVYHCGLGCSGGEPASMSHVKLKGGCQRDDTFCWWKSPEGWVSQATSNPRNKQLGLRRIPTWGAFFFLKKIKNCSYGQDLTRGELASMRVKIWKGLPTWRHFLLVEFSGRSSFSSNLQPSDKQLGLQRIPTWGAFLLLSYVYIYI